MLLTGTSVTVTSQEADLSPAVAFIVVEPALIAVTTPSSETVATAEFDDDHLILLLVAFAGSTVAESLPELPSTSESEV